tara:strand:+ start:345 stop:1538 length:1194 start_codon:yes stop_codon:yes gene_type:complete
MTSRYEEIDTMLRRAEMDEAANAIQSLLSENAKDAEALVLNARLLGASGKADEALTNLEQALMIDQNHVQARIYKAANLYDGGQHDEAETLIRAVVKDDANAHAAWFNLARVEARKNNFSEALSALDSALKIDASNAHYLFAKSSMLEALNREQEAFDALKASIEANPKLEQGWYVLSGWLLEMGQAQEALENLEQAVQLVAPSDGLVELLGRAAVEAGQPEKAVKVFEVMLEDHQENPGVWFNYGAANLASENYALAEKAFRKTIALDPNDVDAVHELANLISLADEPEAQKEAEELLQQVIQKAESSWEAHNDLGRLYLSSEDPAQREAGLRSFEKAVEISGNDPLVVFNLALASAELDDLDRARKICDDLTSGAETPEEIRERASELKASLVQA